jgi:hypothetical protein
MSSKLEAASLNEEEWTRSDNFQTDMLRAFQCGEFYDCTFQVYSKDGHKKVFNYKDFFHFFEPRSAFAIFEM